MNKLLFILFSLCLGLAGQGQSNATLAYMQHFSENDLNHANFFEKKKTLFGIDALTTLEPMYEYTSKAGVAHYKYQQHYKGLPIVGQVFFLDEKEGKVFRSRGNVVPSLEIATEPRISKEVAQQSAKNRVWAQLLNESPEMPKTRGDLPELAIEKEQLVIIPSNYPSKHGNYVLAYKIRVGTVDKHIVQDVYINANDGGFIFKNDVAKQHNVPAVAKTRYYGDQQIIVDSLGPNKYELIDRSRGQYVVAYNDKGNFGENLMDNDKVWELNGVDDIQAVLDAYYCSEKFYDLMFQNFNWRGINGNGSPVVAIVEEFAIYGPVNAYWTGDSAHFGVGACSYGPLTTFEVVGHEFTHGITEYTSKLIYESESGAINEGMSDCFGKALEWVYSPEKFSWTVSQSFIIGPEAIPFRSMSDPKKYKDPEMYKGEYWYNGNDVHINSSILNHWFYLMVEGKTGVNELGTSYDVSSNNMLDVLGILWLCQTSYLTESSNYNDLVDASLLATVELYGENSTIYADAVEAWKAVNLPCANPKTGDLSVYFGSIYELCDTVFRPEFAIINEGDSSIVNSPSFNLIFNGISKTITLPALFKSGETLLIESEEFVVDVAPGYSMFQCAIDYLDDDVFNNSQYLILNVKSPTISFETFLPKELNGLCYGPDIHLAMRITNQSCFDISFNENSYLVLVDKQNNTVLQNIDLDGYVLYKNDDFSFPLDIDHTALANQNGNNNLGIIIVHNNEHYSFDYEVKYSQEKKALYENKLDEIDDAQEWNLIGNFSLISYNGKTFLKTDFNDKDQIVCLDKDIDSWFDYNHSYFEACFDLSSMSKPAISFDAALFRESDDGNPLRSYLKVGTKEDWYHQLAIINDTPNGEVKNYIIPLPSYFSGRIQFDFYSEQPNPNLSTLTDYQLIDNIKIIDLTATNELPVTESQDAFYPNPSSGLWHYQAALGKVEQLSCVDPLGKPYTLTMQDNEVNAQHLNSGLYFLRWKANGQYYVQKMVVMQ